MLNFDYSKLLGKITEIYGNNSNFASSMGFSERTASLKLNNKVEWKQKEILKAAKLLGITPDSIYEYFFKEKVQ